MKVNFSRKITKDRFAKSFIWISVIDVKYDTFLPISYEEFPHNSCEVDIESVTIKLMELRKSNRRMFHTLFESCINEFVENYESICNKKTT